MANTDTADNFCENQSFREEPKAGELEPRATADDLVTGTELTVASPTSLEPSVVGSLIEGEERSWKRIYELKTTEQTYETRELLAEEYRTLAAFYANAGGTEAALRLIKKSLELREDSEFKKVQARFEGQGGDLNFINTYESLLKESDDPKLYLEYCFFLERRSFHDAAIGIFETALKKKILQASHSTVIDSFLALLHTQGTVDAHARISDYNDIIRSYLPKEAVYSLTYPTLTIDHTVLGKLSEEYQEHYGLEDAIHDKGKLLLFFFRHYTLLTAVGVFCGLVFILSIFPISFEFIYAFINLGGFLLLLLIAIQVVRAAGQPQTARRRSLETVSNHVIIASVAVFALRFGSTLFGLNRSVFHPALLSIATALLVGAMLVRAYLAQNTIRRILAKAFETSGDEFVRRAYAEQIAGIVHGSAYVSFWLLAMAALQFLPPSDHEIKIFFLLKALFLFLCWRWSKLAIDNEKRRQREHLVALIVFSFSTSIAWAIYIGFKLQTIVLFCSVDAMMLLGVAVAFALQFVSLNWFAIALCGSVFLVLNFLPVLERFVPSLDAAISDSSSSNIALTTICTNLVLCSILIALVLDKWMKMLVAEKGHAMSETTNRKVSFGQIAFLLAMGAVFIAFLGVLLGLGTQTSAIKLYLVLIGFLLFIGFVMPFVLRFLGLINQERWLGAFGKIVAKIPSFTFPTRSKE
jgi:tetratricopeptide (TPR) repeat protein